jgi:hypothetical protein
VAFSILTRGLRELTTTVRKLKTAADIRWLKRVAKKHGRRKAK